jgi:hypothetical protein
LDENYKLPSFLKIWNIQMTCLFIENAIFCKYVQVSLVFPNHCCQVTTHPASSRSLSLSVETASSESLSKINSCSVSVYDFIPIDYSEVEIAIEKMKRYKSPGTD